MIADTPPHPTLSALRLSRGEPIIRGFIRSINVIAMSVHTRPLFLYLLALLPALPVSATPSLSAPTDKDLRGLDVRDMAALERVSSPRLSPDGSMVVMTLRRMTAAGSADTGVYLRHLLTRDLAAPRRLTPEGWNASAPTFSPDGQRVYFLSDRSGTQQLYVTSLDGQTPQPLTQFALDIGSYRLSPDGRQVAFSAETLIECGVNFACTRQHLEARKTAKTSAVVYDKLFVRHWDTWADGRRSRLFVFDLPETSGAAVTRARALSIELDGDIPSKPFGSTDEYTWAPDGQSVVASVRIAGNTEPWSTNFDLYRLPVDGGGPVNLTADSPAWDTGPVFSADGRTLYYRAMKRPGFEADRFALMALDLASGQHREIAPLWDRSADTLALSADGRALYVTAQDIGQRPLFRVDISSGKVEPLFVEGTVTQVEVAGNTIALTRNSMHSHDQLLVFSPQTSSDGRISHGPVRTITTSASEQLPEVRMGDFEQFSFHGWNNALVYGYVLKPWNYEAGRKYPVAFLIHGGPQGSFGNSWSYRWNPQTYAGQGYAVVMIDFHGSTGYGQAFTDAISGHWGDRPLEDLKKGWAAVLARYDFLDDTRACALGASYGGYMVNWIASQWNAPWKCLVSHNGVFDTRSMGLVTEELWFTEWEFGGTVMDKPEAYERFNPARHIDKWQVPTLIIAGQNDFRVPLDQSLSAFTALQRQGIKSRLLYFPDENHWVNKPDNSIQWHDTVNEWLRQHIGQ